MVKGTLDSKQLSFISKKVSKELFYQGYIASRLTGLTPANVKRAIRSAMMSRYYLTFIFIAFLVGLLIQGSLFQARNELLLPVGVFAWFLLPLFVSLMQFSYGASAGPQMREFLLMLPIENNEINRIASRAILSTIELPIVASMIVIVASFFVLGPWIGLAALLSETLSFSVAMCSIAAVFKLFRSSGNSGLLSTLKRGLTTFPIAMVILLYAYVQSSRIELATWEKLFVPLLNLTGVAEGNVTSLGLASLYSLIALTASYVAFRGVSLTILSPIEYVSSKIASFKVKIRRPEFALIVSDFRVVFRSPRLSGLLFAPIMYTVILVFANALQVRHGNPLMLETFLVADSVPIGLVSSFFPYMLYLAEMKGLSYIRMLPLGKFTNLKSKLYVSLTFYGISAAIMGFGFYISSFNAEFFVPLASLALALVACVIYTSIHFEKSTRNMMMGTIGLVNQVVYYFVNGILFGIPASIYFVGIFIMGNLLAPAPYSVAISLAEIVLMVWLLRRNKEVG